MTRLDIFIRNALLLKLHVHENDITLSQETMLVKMVQEIYNNKHLMNEAVEARIEHVISLYQPVFPK